MARSGPSAPSATKAATEKAMQHPHSRARHALRDSIKLRRARRPASRAFLASIRIKLGSRPAMYAPSAFLQTKLIWPNAVLVRLAGLRTTTDQRLALRVLRDSLEKLVQTVPSYAPSATKDATESAKPRARAATVLLDSRPKPAAAAATNVRSESTGGRTVCVRYACLDFIMIFVVNQPVRNARMDWNQIKTERRAQNLPIQPALTVKLISSISTTRTLIEMNGNASDACQEPIVNDVQEAIATLPYSITLLSTHSVQKTGGGLFRKSMV